MWQPIETAPRNQTFLAVLNCAGEQTICTMRWPVAEAKNSRPDSKTFHVERVTHWMPLPDLPGAQPAPSVPDEVMRERVMDAIAQALGDAYDCTRVWSAWGYGTMSQDDFYLIAEDSDRLREIADAAIMAMLAAAPKPEGE